MKSLIFLWCVVVSAAGPVDAYSQTVRSIQPPPASAAVAVETVEWTTQQAEYAPVALALKLKNKTEDRTVKSIQVSMVAMDKKGVVLQDNGTTLCKLGKATIIAPGETRTILLDKTISASRVDKVQVKQVVVEFTNGSLEILQ